MRAMKKTAGGMKVERCMNGMIVIPDQMTDPILKEEALFWMGQIEINRSFMTIKNPEMKKLVEKIKSPPVLAFLFFIFVIVVLGLIVEFINPYNSLETLVKVC